VQTPLDLPEWGNANMHHQDHHNIMQRTPTSATGSIKRPPLPSPAISDPFILPSLPSQGQMQHNLRKIKRQNTGPIGLSLADDDFGDSNNSASTSKSSGSNQMDSLVPISPVASRSGKFMTSPGHGGEASADLLYEYFPLSVDDWMPPVDAIYRPHVVHHTVQPPELKAQRNKSKRYFSADD